MLCWIFCGLSIPLERCYAQICCCSAVSADISVLGVVVTDLFALGVVVIVLLGLCLTLHDGVDGLEVGRVCDYREADHLVRHVVDSLVRHSCEKQWVMLRGRSHLPNTNAKLFTTGMSLFFIITRWYFTSHIWQQLPPQMELSEFISVKQCSDQAKANAKAKIFFDVCHLLVDLFRFRTRFRSLHTQMVLHVSLPP